MAMLLLPPVFSLNELNPIAIFAVPFKLLYKELLPTAVFEDPVFLNKVLLPTAVLDDAVAYYYDELKHSKQL